jgi:CspA family cold shock protein
MIFHGSVYDNYQVAALLHRIRNGQRRPGVASTCPEQYLWLASTSCQSGNSCYRRDAKSKSETNVASGTVKWFNPTKGYGFIQPQGGGKDVFVHISAVERAGLSTLNEGQQLDYEIVANRGRDSAENLKVK